MRTIVLAALLPLTACAVDPCPPYSGLRDGRTWTFDDDETGSTEVREIRSIDDDGVVSLRARFTSESGQVTTLEQRLRCDEDGVRLLEDSVESEAFLSERTFIDPPVVLPPDPQPGDRFGGETVAVETNAGDDEVTQPEIRVDENDPIASPLGELEVLAFLVLGPNGDPLPDVGVLRHAEFGLVEILGGATLTALEDE